MSHNVLIQPCGRRTENHPGESLLESALNTGLPVSYGCSNGNCGECRARLIEGTLQRLRHSDFVLSEEERENGNFLMCCHAAASDIAIDTSLATDAEDIPRQEIEVKVKKITALDDHYTLVHVQTPRTRRLRFLAGQAARLSSNSNSCTLPIASCPCDDRNIHFHIPRDPTSCAGTDRLARLRPGTTLQLDGPIGDFVLDAESSRPRVMIGAGLGMAPIKSIIEHSLALAPEIPVALILVELREDPHYLGNLLRSWRDALDNFTYSTLEFKRFPRPEDIVCHFREAAFHPASQDYYISGPPDVLAGCRSAFMGMAVPERQIHEWLI